MKDYKFPYGSPQMKIQVTKKDYIPRRQRQSIKNQGSFHFQAIVNREGMAPKPHN